MRGRRTAGAERASRARAAALLALAGTAAAPALAPLVAGCAEEAAPTTLEPVEVEAWVEARRVGAGEPVRLVVRSWTAEGWTLELNPPEAPGMEVRPEGADGPVADGGRERRTARYALIAEPGSYVVQPASGTARGPGGEERPVEAPPIFVDIGVEGPTAGELAGWRAAPGAAGAPAWWPWAAAGAALAALGVGAWAWRRRRSRPEPPAPPEPPEARARRRWREAREAGLDDHALALVLSRVLREYLEERFRWPATAGTTREVLARIEARGLLDAAQRLRAARVLDATDRLKFAREGGGCAFFDELEADFEAVLAAAARRSPEEPLEAP